MQKELEDAIEFTIKKYNLDRNNSRFMFLALTESKQKEFIDIVQVAKYTSDFNYLRSFLIRNDIIDSNVSEKIRDIVQEMSVHIIGAHQNLNIQSTKNISLKDFVSMFVSTVDDNLELKSNNVTLVDELLLTYGSHKMHWRKKMMSYFNALKDRGLLDEYVVKDIEKSLV